VTDENKTLEGRIAVLRGQVEDTRASLRVGREKEKALEGMHTEFLNGFKGHNRRLREMRVEQ